MSYSIHFDNEEEAQYCLEAIDDALIHANEYSKLYPNSIVWQRETKQLRSIKQKLEAMLEDEE